MTYEDVLFQNPGPTNIPSSVLDAMRRPVIDFRSSAFGEIFQDCLAGLAKVLKTSQTVAILPASGHGAWETALVNLFSPGDRLLVLSLGYFGDNWADYARRFGLETIMHQCDPRKGIDFPSLAQTLRSDRDRTIKGVLVTHCETSTGVLTDVAEVRKTLDDAGHPALLLADVISSLACADFRMDEWGVDVAAGAVQKGLMMPTGLSFVGVSGKALDASKSARLPRAYWDLREMLLNGKQVNTSGTAPVQMFYGLQQALHLIADEGLDTVLRRHIRFAAAVRQAVRMWSAEPGDLCLYVDDSLSSPSVTAILLKREGIAERIRSTALTQCKVQIGGGIGQLMGKIIRIGHMGKLHNSQLMGALAGVQLAMLAEGVRLHPGGLDAAIEVLSRRTTSSWIDQQADKNCP